MIGLLAVLSTMHYEGDVAPGGGDYAEVAFAVPTGTVEIQVAHTDGSDFVILDWGVWSPEGFRGWGGGLEDDAVIGVAQSSRSYLAGPITPGTWRVVIGKAKVDPATGGHYSIDVTCRDKPTLAVAPTAAYTPVVLSTERRWYRGDFHVHSENSGDATATFAQIATLARMRGLDFVNLSDHNTSSHLPLMAAFQATQSDLLLLRGAEITTYQGHGNSVGTSAYVDHRIGLAGRTIGAVLDDVAAQNGIFIVNHPALDLGGACIGCSWKHDIDWTKVAGIEVLTGKWDLTERLFTPGALAMWDAALDAGARIAAIGGSDDHRAGAGTGSTDTPLGSPTTLVLADNLSEAAIMEGIKAGRTIVQLRGPDDPLVELTLGDAQIGDTVEGSVQAAELRVHIIGGAGNFAQLWRNGTKADQVEITSDDFTHTFVDDTGGAHRFRVELINDANNRIVITSHIYVTVTPGGCGCATSGPMGSGVLALLAALTWWRAGRSARRAARDRAGSPAS